MYYDFWTNDDGDVVFVSDAPNMGYSELTNMFQLIGVNSSYESRQFKRVMEIIDDPLDAEELRHMVRKIMNKKMGVAGIAGELCKGWEVRHPVENRMAGLSTVIMSLNDRHRWTREEIADWLDTLPDQPKMGGNNA